MTQVESRLRRTLSEKPLRKDERVLVVGKLASDVFKRLVTMPLHVTYGDAVLEGYDRVLIEWTMDDECVAFLEQMGRESSVNVHVNDSVKNGSVKLFISLRDKEVAAYAQLRGIPFEPRAKDTEWSAFLAAFDDHPDMMYNLVKNVQEMKDVQETKNLQEMNGPTTKQHLNT